MKRSYEAQLRSAVMKRSSRAPFTKRRSRGTVTNASPKIVRRAWGAHAPHDGQRNHGNGFVPCGPSISTLSFTFSVGAPAGVVMRSFVVGFVLPADGRVTQLQLAPDPVV